MSAIFTLASILSTSETSEGRQTRVLAVNDERVLNQVVRPNREKVGLSREITYDFDCRGYLNHCSKDRRWRLPTRMEIRECTSDESFDLSKLLKRPHHWNENAQRPVAGR